MNGIIYFAKTTNETNYVKLAQFSASLLRPYLKNIELCIITDSNDLNLSNYFDRVINYTFEETDNKYYIYDKLNVYWLSPYKKTLLLDADLLLFDLTTLHLFEASIAIGATHSMYKHIQTFLGTLLYFQQCAEVERFFTTCSAIKNNYYAEVLPYFPLAKRYRNDFVLSIANIRNPVMAALDTQIQHIKHGIVQHINNNSIVINNVELLNTNIHFLDKTILLKYIENL
ncbi:MAG: hypothetical protein HC836_25715 [Richelia sp. RM2_1_2]|nr:hypothetical protein [Richelia sp. RM2_1_2]